MHSQGTSWENSLIMTTENMVDRIIQRVDTFVKEVYPHRSKMIDEGPPHDPRIVIAGTQSGW